MAKIHRVTYHIPNHPQRQTHDTTCPKRAEAVAQSMEAQGFEVERDVIWA